MNKQKLEQHATRMAFLIAGLATAAWAPLVPYAQTRIGIEEGTLGLLLLCLGAGSIIAMPAAGIAAARYGCRKLIIMATIVLCVALPWLAVSSSLLGMALGLLIFGAAIGTIDVVINLQAILVEKQAGRMMMSGFHGLFSLGGVVGAAGVSLALSLGLSPLGATLIACAVMLALLIALGRHLLAHGSEQRGPIFVMPHGLIFLVGLMCFICFLAEGAMLDWSAVFLTTVRGVDPATAGLGYAAFATTMTIGRLTGDTIVRVLGGTTVIIAGSICAATGLIAAVVLPNPAMAFIGFALIGIGASNIVPVLYSAAGRQHAMPPHLAIAAVTMLGYSGILSGPALIGFVAHAASLPIAFLGIAMLMLLLGACGRMIRTN